MGIFNNDLGKKIYILPQEEVSSSTDAPTVSSEPNIIILTATETFNKTETSSLTQYPISTGATVSDHYKFDNTTINFSGILSSTSNLLSFNGFYGHDTVDSTEDVILYIKKLRELVRGVNSSPLVTIYLPDSNGETNCVITSLRISKDVSISNGYKVDISAKKLLLATTQFKTVSSSSIYEPEEKQGQETGSLKDSVDDEILQDSSYLF